MAEIKVSELPEASQTTNNDLLMIVQDNTSKKITVENTNFAKNIMYDTNEVDTGNTWIDNKPIYRKVLSDTNIHIDSVDQYEIAAGITNVDTVISINTTLFYDGMWFTHWHFTDVAYKKSRNVVYILGDSSATFPSGYFIIEYTKTTD